MTICRDAEVLDFMRQFRERHRRMPTTKELCNAIHIQRGQLLRNIARLVRDGKLTPMPVGMLRFVPSAAPPPAALPPAPPSPKANGMTIPLARLMAGR